MELNHESIKLAELEYAEYLHRKQVQELSKEISLAKWAPVIDALFILNFALLGLGVILEVIFG